MAFGNQWHLHQIRKCKSFAGVYIVIYFYSSSFKQPLEPLCLYAILNWGVDFASWHWLLFVSDLSGARGTSFHVIRNTLHSPWKFDVSAGDAVRSRETICIIKIGDLSSLGSLSDILLEMHDTLKYVSVPTLGHFDMCTNSEFTCRTWFLSAVRALDERGFVECEDITKLEKEIKCFVLQASAVHTAKGRWLFFVSQFCS
jgi:hypothetical protein